MPIPLHWHTEPLLLITILGIGWLYTLLIGPLSHKIKDSEPVHISRICLFYSGLILAYVTVGSPIDQIGEDFLFSMHMVQHMLLIYALPPLFILGVPPWLWNAIVDKPVIKPIWKLITNPVLSGLLLTFLYTAWHIPKLYELALINKQAHVLEHWCMFLPAFGYGGDSSLQVINYHRSTLVSVSFSYSC